MEDVTLIYRGSGDDDDLYAAYAAKNDWLQNMPIRDQVIGVRPKSNVTPSAVVLEDTLFLLYKGPAHDHNLYLASYTGGRWSGGGPLKAGKGKKSERAVSETTPNLIAFNGSLHFVYKQPDDEHLYFATLDKEGNYTSKKIGKTTDKGTTPKSQSNPAFAEFHGRFYIAYRSDRDDDLHYAWYHCGAKQWFGGDKVHKQPTSQFPPSLVTFKGKLHLFYRTKGKDGKVRRLSYDIGKDRWSGNRQVHAKHKVPGKDREITTVVRATGAPGLAATGSDLYLGYSRDSQIYTARFERVDRDGEGNLPVAEQMGDIAPKSDVSPAVIITDSNITTPSGAWMQAMAGDTKLTAINIPGSHNAAARLPAGASPIHDWTKHWWACQDISIFRQLELGVRMLDIRLKVDRINEAPGYDFWTCHGDWNKHLAPEKFVDFESVLETCGFFLRRNSKEALIMSLKVGNWGVIKNDEKPAALQALNDIMKKSGLVYQTSAIPTLGDVRGKMWVFNREKTPGDFPFLGTRITWPYSTKGARKRVLGAKFYIQDEFDMTLSVNPLKSKLARVVGAFKQYGGVDAVWNYANIWSLRGTFHTELNKQILSHFGPTDPKNNRLRNFGWLLLDFVDEEFETDIYGRLKVIDMVIASNFRYEPYDKAFQVL